MKKYALLFLLTLGIQGCAGWLNDAEVAKTEKELTPVPAVPVATVAAPVAPAKGEVVDEEPMMRYSQMNNMAPPSDRQYKRMTRKKMEEESDLNSSAGSLWKMEGQTSYLFAENKHRREGDTTAIKMEASALKIIESKAWVISDLIGQLEEQKKVAEEEAKKAAQEKLRLAQIEAEKKLRAERIAKGEIVVDPLDDQPTESENKAFAEVRQPASASVNNKKVAEEKIDLKEVELIPSKIVEKMNDDTYRIRGQQFLTIKKRPYKVIATALVRAEDFSDAGVSSNKLIDAQYDVIHLKRTANE